MQITSSLLSLLLVPLLILQPLHAFQLTDTSILEIHAVDDDGKSIAPGSLSPKGFSVQVTDGSGSTVADAAVVIRFPDDGATASFADGSHSAIVYTDLAGRVQISGIHWSTQPGTVPIKITATKGMAHAGTLVEKVLSFDVHRTVDAQPVEQRSLREPFQARITPVVTSPPTGSKADQQPSTPGSPAIGVRANDSVLENRQPRLTPPSTGLEDSPSVSILNRRPGQKFDDGGSGHKKLIVLLVVAAAGAGAAFAFTGKKGSSSSSSSSASTGLTIGNPTLTVSAP